MFRYAFNAVKTRLAYTLKEVESGLIFQITEQSKDITDFLNANSYRATNGMLISSSKYPEFKDSEYTIFLRGNDPKYDFKLDVTRFVGNMQRDKRKAQIKAALREFVDHIKNASREYAYTAPFSAPYACANVIVLG